MWILLLTIYLLGIIVSNWLAILYFRKDDDISISQLIAIILTSFFSWLSLVSKISGMMQVKNFPKMV